MENHHEKSPSLTKALIADIEQGLLHAWCLETCYPPSRNEWSVKNPALGQCAATALVIHDLFGGTFADDKVNNHVWNILPDGSQHDFSRTQFLNPVNLEATSVKTREDLLNHPRAEEVEMRKRYELLKERFLRSNNRHP